MSTLTPIIDLPTGILRSTLYAVTTVTLQPVLSGIQFPADRVSDNGIVKGATAFSFVV